MHCAQYRLSQLASLCCVIGFAFATQRCTLHFDTRNLHDLDADADANSSTDGSYSDRTSFDSDVRSHDVNIDTRTDTTPDLIANCADGMTACGMGCASLNSDPEHCGTCAQQCSAAQMCSGGTCVSVCPTGQMMCPDGCRDLATDSSNCGICGHSCPGVTNGSTVCTSGACTLQCAPGFGDCDMDLTTGCEVDMMHTATRCGGCGISCPFGPNSAAMCGSGHCSISCDAGFADCDGVAANGCEVDLRSDIRHCGTCATACAVRDNATPECNASACSFRCVAGYLDCDGLAATGCEASMGGSANCGACGTMCGAGAPYCMATGGGSFACTNGCASGTTLCGGSCADTSGDSNNCSACGVVCPAVIGATRTCSGGGCGFTCHTNFDDCDGNLANGCETDLRVSPLNCMACGNICPSGPNSTRTCSAGRCGISCSPGFADCNGNPLDGCEVNTVTDSGNCGTCVHACPGGANAAPVCTLASCGLSCNANFADCDHVASNGCEADLTSNVANCNRCGDACPSRPNSSPVCSNSRCGISCSPGYADCDGNPANGCEVNTTLDVANCGTCMHACSNNTNATGMCSFSACTNVCANHFGDCDHVVGNGCEVDTSSNVANCGACSSPCPSGIHSTAMCSGSTCGIRCSAGFTDCDGVASTGCEVNTDGDRNNCGGCGTMCPVRANATASCTAATCGFSCQSGFADCDMIATNGCESQLASDPLNCNACDARCPTAANATTTCSSGACGYQCSTGWDDCDGLQSTGCETDLTTDVAHCGSCAVICDQSQQCNAGSCE